MRKWTELLHMLVLLESMHIMWEGTSFAIAETDAFLQKIENHDFAFLPLAREFVEERD